MQDMSGFLLFAADADTMLRAGSKPAFYTGEAESELRRAADDRMPLPSPCAKRAK